jgi:hypothetical protein
MTSNWKSFEEQEEETQEETKKKKQWFYSMENVFEKQEIETFWKDEEIDVPRNKNLSTQENGSLYTQHYNNAKEKKKLFFFFSFFLSFSI